MANTKPVIYTGNFTMRIDSEFAAALDELRATERPVLTRAEMIRKLVADATAAKASRKKGSSRPTGR